MYFNRQFALTLQLDRDVNAALVHDPESGRRSKVHRSASYFTMRIIAQAFTMTFLAEWGDRSQLTTIILAASKVSTLLNICFTFYITLFNLLFIITFIGRLWRYRWRCSRPLHMHWLGCDWRSSCGFQNLGAHCHHRWWHCIYWLCCLRDCHATR